MRVLIITDVTMPGGVDTYTCQLVNMALRRHYRVRVLIGNEVGVDKLFANLKQLLGRECFRDLISKKNPREIKLSAVERQIQDFAPDIIHVICGAIHSALDIREYIAKKSIPFLFTESLIDEKYQFEPDIKLRVKSIYEKTQKVITVSRNNASIICNKFQLPGEKIVSIANGVDASMVKQREHFPTNIFRFVTVARLCEQKGIDILLDAVKELYQKGEKNFHVDVWGDGDLRSGYQEVIGRYGISEFVSLKGWCDHITNILCRYDVFVLPSRYEGMPISLMEAMAAKLPCIATDVSGIPEILDNGTYGVLIEPEKAYKLEEAMSMVMNNYSYYHCLAEKAYIHICEAHDSYQNMSKVAEIWNKAVKDEKEDLL